MEIHTLTYDHGNIEVNVADDDHNHIATQFTLEHLLEADPDAREAWERFGGVVQHRVEEILMALLRGAVVPDSVPVVGTPLECRICQIHPDDPRLFGIDESRWQVLGPGRAYCPDHRIAADG